MMTGFNIDSHSINSMVQGMEEDLCNRSHLISGLGVSNSSPYGLSEGRYQSPDCSTIPATVSMAHVSISDEELCEALNISPPFSSSMGKISTDYIQNISPVDISTITHNSTSEYTFPSSSSLDQGMATFENHAMYLPRDMISPSVSPRLDVISPTFSINSFAPTSSTVTAEVEDLEVEMINASRAENRTEINDDINIFLRSVTSENELRSSKGTSYSEDNSNNNTPSERPAYAKKLSASSHKNTTQEFSSITTCSDNQNRENQYHLNNNPSTTSPLFLETSEDSTGFTPLLTPKSDALLKTKLRRESLRSSEQQSTSRHDIFDTVDFKEAHPECVFDINLFPRNSEREESNSFRYDPIQGILSDFSESSFDNQQFNNQGERKRPHNRIFIKNFSKLNEIPDFSDLELEDKSKEIAVDVVEKLFAVTKREKDSAPTGEKDTLRSISQLSTRPPAKKIRFPRCSLEERMNFAKKNMDADQTDDVLDDWETADDEELTSRMERLLSDVKKKDERNEELKKIMNSQSSSNWDSNVLPNVIEIYAIPDYKMQDDVVRALEIIGFGDANLKWIERKIVLAAFDSYSRAKQCLNVRGHEWLRFRSLAHSPENVQKEALTRMNSLTSTQRRRNQTNPSVARRMVENVLGKKSSVSDEQRNLERKQIEEARAAKKNSVKWD